MKEYIEREAVKDEILSWAVCINHPEYLSTDDTLYILDNMPAADVAPVRHGTGARPMNIKLEKDAFMPARAHLEDAGLDLRSPVDTIVPAGGSAVIDTGVHVELPAGTAGLIVSKSGLNVKYGLTSEGLIDEGYTGSIVVKLYNNSDTDFFVKRGDKISQLVIIPVRYDNPREVPVLKSTARGTGGFGSTGR